jgi:hypothetical protein
MEQTETTGKTKEQILKDFFLSKSTPEEKLQAGYAVFEGDFLKFFFLTFDRILMWHEKETYRIGDSEDIAEFNKKLSVEFLQFDGEKFSKRQKLAWKDISRKNAPLKNK